ncbi:T9SS type A sorting domain-containing protein [bacterium]|nr:T9SS type A sorting domain-containing protein [bacterium]
MKQVLLSLIAVFLIAGVSQAQFTEAWDTRAVNAYNSERFQEGVEHADGGVVAVGGQFNQGIARFETVLCRMDVNGNVQWRNSYVYNNQTTSMFGMTTRTGYTDQFIAVGYTEPSAREFFLMVFNDAGNVLNTYIYNLYSGGEMYSIEPVPAGGYICSGITNSGSGFILKLNDDFTIDWHNIYGSYATNRIYDVIPTSDGGFAFTALVYTAPNRYAWTAKINSAGTYIWTSVHTSFYFGVGRCVVEAPDGGIITAGYYDNGPGDQFLVIKNNTNGAQVWSSSFGVDSGDEYCDFIGAAPGGGYYLFGDGESQYTIDGDTWLIKINESGNEEWSQLFRRNLNQTIENAVMVNGGQDIVTLGEENIFWSNDGDCNAVRYNSTGDLEAEIAALSPPVNIPAGGGSFGYSVTATNNTDSPMQVDAWIQVLHLNSGMSVEVRLFENVGLAANASASANLNQTIPAAAPGGDYQIGLFLGGHPWDQQAFASFEFSKAGTAADAVDFGVFEQSELWHATGGFEAGAEAVVTADDATVPSEFALDAAYPNPFNPSTTLAVNLPETAELTVAVYNVTGQQVATLAQDSFNAGSHTLTFDASHLSGGIYFVRASANGWNAVQKVVLMK